MEYIKQIYQTGIVDIISEEMGYHELDYKTLYKGMEYGNEVATNYGYMPENKFVDIVVKYYRENRESMNPQL